jgi:hypothetical protein
MHLRCLVVGLALELSSTHFFLDGYTLSKSSDCIDPNECSVLTRYSIVRYSVTDPDHFSIDLDPCIDSNHEQFDSAYRS